jgi:hypothetical protein
MESNMIKQSHIYWTCVWGKNVKLEPTLPLPYEVWKHISELHLNL